MVQNFIISDNAQKVSVNELADILINVKGHKAINLTYYNLESRASSKMPFFKTTKQVVCTGAEYKSKLDRRAKDEDSKEALKIEKYAPAWYTRVEGSKTLAKGKKSNEYVLIYQYDLNTINVETRYYLEDKTELSFEDAKARVRASKLDEFTKDNFLPSKKQSDYLNPDTFFMWKGIYLKNIHQIKIEGIVYEVIE